MLIDDSRTFWKPLMSKFSFFMDLYRQFRPLIFLPFNIWFFFVALPFRLFFAITSSFWNSQSPSLEQVKEKVTELKEEVVIPTLRPNTTVQRRPLHSDSDRLHGWFAVEKADVKDESKTHRRRKSLTKSEDQSDRSVEQPKEEMKEESKEISRDETGELRAQLAQIEDRERATLEQKQSLERQLEELTAKYNTDEQALATFDHDKQRFRNLISVEQKKCFDFQQQIIALKNQLKSEHESKVRAEEQLNLLKKQNKTEKRKASKADKSLKSSDESISAVGKQSTTVTPAADSHPSSAWHTSEHKSFTEMVADAQREELEHKSFSEVLKTAVHINEPTAPLTDSKPEFVVIGGDLSTQHVTAL